MFGVDQIAVYLKIHTIYTLQYDYLVGAPACQLEHCSCLAYTPAV
jgi:hypothetical protein